ncbi:MAG: hypothetical protein O2894_06105 [Planctomycetota bacterium]|nr:hypothetical protein [Planctomycetota bacterium]
MLLSSAGAAATVGPALWRQGRLTGLANPTGVTLAGDDLVLVCGGDDRDIYTVPRADLRAGGSVAVRKLAVTIRGEAPVSGSEPFAAQGYTLQHLWAVPVDFQAVAFQAPDILYVGERHRRLVLWGRLRRDAAGRPASVNFDHVALAPGARRTGADAGDWRDRGPGLRGLVSVRLTARMEDLWVVDEGAADEPIAVRRMDRYGSNLQGLRARHGFTVGPDVRAISWDQDRLVILMGSGRGRFITLTPPAPGKLESVPEAIGVPGPDIEGVDGWQGMAHAGDGTAFLVGGGATPVVVWRRP